MKKLHSACLAILFGAVAASAAPDKPVSFTKVQLSDQFWAEGANFGDFNHDGAMDIASGPFWYEGPDFTVKHQYRPQIASFVRTNADGSTETIPGFEGALGSRNTYSDNFYTFVYDFNHDGWPDILVIGFPGAPVSWYENPHNAAGDWPRHDAADSVDNESPAFLDIDGDGKPELVCNAHGYFGYYAVNWANPAAPWTFHAISPKGSWGRFTHGLGVGDINGDGRMDLLEKDGWWEQPVSLANDPPTNHPRRPLSDSSTPSPPLLAGQQPMTFVPVWKFHPFPFAPGPGTAGAAQMFAYDVNGDGLNDVITCLNPHGYGIVWYEQVRTNGDITFKQHMIAGATAADNPTGVHFSQPHSMALADIDGDGLLDIVTGKRFWAHGKNGPDPESDGSPAVLYWFQLQRLPGGEARFIPHLIDSDSGVGTQVVVDPSSRDIVVGNKKGLFLFRHHQ